MLLCHLIVNKTKPNRDSLTLVALRFLSVISISFEFYWFSGLSTFFMTGRVATGQEMVRKDKNSSRSGKSQGILF